MITTGRAAHGPREHLRARITVPIWWKPGRGPGSFDDDTTAVVG
ncbi:hypothetical protein [Plantactinospora sp. CA-290183]